MELAKEWRTDRFLRKLEALLLQEKRLVLAEKVFSFLKIRVELDLAGFEDLDVFAH